MAKCDVCRNDSATSFDIATPRGTYTFDGFECAIHRLAPSCAHCGCRIIGQGLAAGGQLYCWGHCAREAGKTSARGVRTESHRGSSGGASRSGR